MRPEQLIIQHYCITDYSDWCNNLPPPPLSQGHASDVFEAYSQLLTEMVLRLPYQIKKIADTNPRIPPPIFDHSWFYFLSEVTS